MLRDRGTKKWTSIMMPEHAKMLEHIWSESEHKEKPLLDEQQKNENDLMLQRTIHDNLIVEIKYFKDYDFHMIKGRVSYIDVLSGCLSVSDTEIRLDDIIEVNTLLKNGEKS